MPDEIEAPEVETPVEQPTEEAPTEEKTETEEKPASEEQLNEKPKKNRVSARERIGQLTREKGDATREVEALKKKVEELQQSRKIDKEPVEDDFPDYSQFQEAKFAYSKQQKEAEEASRQAWLESEIAKRKAQELQSEKKNKWDAQRSKAATKYEDFSTSEEFVGAVAAKYQNQDFIDAILSSDDGAAIVNYFGQNTDEAERIARLPLASATRELVKLETQLKPNPKKQTSAPAPVETPGAGSKTIPDLSRMTGKEYDAYMNKKEFGR